MSREVPEYECEQCRGMSDERPCPRCAAIDKHSEKRYTAADLAAAESAAYKRGMLRAAEICDEHYNGWLKANKLHSSWQSYAIKAIRKEAEKP